MIAAAHKQTARRLVGLAHSLDHRDRKFVEAIARMERPSPAQLQWLARVEGRASRLMQGELRHA